MVDVFISYSRSNRDRVRVLADAVKALGYIVWWDDELPPHKSYGDVITEKIAGARAAIVCWSGDAAQSEWVRAEADLARNQKKLIQTSYDDVMPPMPFNQIQFASLADWQGQADHSGWRKVQASLTDLCGPPGTDRPAPAPMPPPPAPPVPPPVSPPVSPPPPHVPQERSEKQGLSPVLLVAIAAVLLAVMAAAGWMMLRGDGPDAVTPDPAIDDDAGPQGTGTGDNSGGNDASRYRLAAMIDDPDGYTNIRAEPTTDSAIVARVNAGEAFTTYEQAGAFWQVRTADGVTGFMARSRIRLIRDGVPPPASTPLPAAPDSASTNSDDAQVPQVPSAGGREGQILPDSDRRRLTRADIAGLGPLQMRLARNEIYARKGRRFKTKLLFDHFSQFSWYRPTVDDVTLTPVEQANVDLLAAAERGR